MTYERSVFFNQWKQSLRDHYIYVIRQNDQITEASLIKVMIEVGFTEDELKTLYQQATMPVNEMRDGFEPDLSSVLSEPKFQQHASDCDCSDCNMIHEIQYDEEGQPLEDLQTEGDSDETFSAPHLDVPGAEATEYQNDEPDDVPQQLRMF